MTATRLHQHQHHQVQYQITPADYRALRARLSAASPDGHGTACVHMLRFYSYRSHILSLPESPADPHFSLSYYDNDPTYLFLERQQGELHTSAMVAEAECRALLSGETGWLLERPNPILREFHDCLTSQMLLPQVLLTFHREFYTLDGLDIWVALDTDVRSSLQHMDFLDPELLARDTAGQEGQLRLEISYSRTIPDEVLSIFVETAPRRRPLAGISAAAQPLFAF